MAKIKITETMLKKMIAESLRYHLSECLLTEATEQSLHQQYDKMFGSQLIEDLLWYDTTPNKKFAEWVIKVCIKQNSKEPQKILIGYLHNSGQLTDLAQAVENGFQPYSFSDIETALENFGRKQIKPAVYKDDTIHIYNPSTYFELKALIKAVAKQPLDSFRWCVSSSDASTFWPQYTKDDEYQIFFIHNIKQNQFYLWNNNPSEDKRKQFNNQENNPVKPIETAGLTDGAVKFLDSKTEHDFVEDVNNMISEETGMVLYEGILGGRYNLYDPNPDDLYHHNLQLWPTENQGDWIEFGNSAYDVLLDSPRLFIMIDNRYDDCSVAYVDENSEILFGNEDKGWGEEYDGIYYVTNIPDKLVVYNQNNGNIHSYDISSPIYIGSVGNFMLVQSDDYDVYYVIDHTNGKCVFKSSDIDDYAIYKNNIELYVDDDFDIDDYENIQKAELENIDAPFVDIERDGRLYYFYNPNS